MDEFKYKYFLTYMKHKYIQVRNLSWWLTKLSDLSFLPNNCTEVQQGGYQLPKEVT